MQIEKVERIYLNLVLICMYVYHYYIHNNICDNDTYIYILTI